MITRSTRLVGAVSLCNVILSFLYLSTLVACSIPISETNLKDRGASQDQYIIRQSIQQPIYGDIAPHDDVGKSTSKPHSKPLDTISIMTDALGVMQQDYFELWQGIWPTSIDWTAAVLGTYLSGALTSLSKSMTYIYNTDPKSTQMVNHENLINRHFSQLVGYYFGQDSFSLRTEAYDDMLWVVLGWLESIKFIQFHSSLHYKTSTHSSSKESQHHEWYGMQWIPSFAHRARLFWDLASQGWDISLCKGGMVWSPYLAPYKNAITNELFITASISMYLYFPGDTNTSPFNVKDGLQQPGKPHDPKYLAAAVEGYKWLTSSNMTDSQGLYVDGYHVSGWSRKHDNGSQVNTRCDQRNEMVYSYNQGVLLSGQRGLWEATGAHSYLEDGHRLISNVINATGYDLKSDRPWPHDSGNSQWAGLGRAGILEDVCDAQGYCNQDGQTFKGIFFHHLTLFCAPLPPHLIEPGEEFDNRAFQELKVWHERSCASYGGWIRHNAKGALYTVNDEGKFGMWWGAPEDGRHLKSEIPDGAIDYRNLGVPMNETWRDASSPKDGIVHGAGTKSDGIVWAQDANDRGRGRTVETQGGGIAVLRALWEIVEFKALDDV